MTITPLVTPRLLTDLTSILSAFELMGVEYDHIGNLWVAATMADETAAVSVTEYRAEVIFRGTFPCTYVQPLPNDELLLVGTGSRLNHSNAVVIGSDGQIARQFSLDSDITAVQAESDGSIWVAYGDMRLTYPSNGLVKYDALGRELESYIRPTDNLPDITESYAFNAAGVEGVWLYYYEFPDEQVFSPDGFPLLLIANGVVTGAWRCPVFGSRHIAIWQDYIVFCGSFDAPNRIFLCRKGDTPDLWITASFRLRENDAIVAARGSRMCIVNNNHLYQLTVQELVTQFELLGPADQIDCSDDTALVDTLGGHGGQVARYGVIALLVVLAILLIIAASGQPGPGNNDDIVPTVTLGN